LGRLVYMTREELTAAYRSQLAMVDGIAKSLNLHLDLPGPPSAALAFAESLLLCPTQHAASEQMRQDRALYAFVLNMPVNSYDAHGLVTVPVQSGNVTVSPCPVCTKRCLAFLGGWPYEQDNCDEPSSNYSGKTITGNPGSFTVQMNDGTTFSFENGIQTVYACQRMKKRPPGVGGTRG
jgi:hypothetical protein